MGTAASIEKPQVYSYQLVERLAIQNHFRNDIEAYQIAMEDSIRRNALDILEILLQAGNARSIYPLHMSASLGVLETMELIVSAGFSCSSKNKEELTPLHCSAMNTSVESAMCAMFLGIRDPNSMNIRDAKGSLPIHIAIERNNLHVVKALIELGTKLTTTNGSGLTPKILAKQLKRLDIESYLIDAEKPKLSQKTKSKRGQPKEAPVDMERIMKVWEKFFENAMSRFDTNVNGNNEYYGATEAEIVDDDDDDCFRGSASDYIVRAQSSRQKGITRSNSSSSSSSSSSGRVSSSKAVHGSTVSTLSYVKAASAATKTSSSAAVATISYDKNWNSISTSNERNSISSQNTTSIRTNGKVGVSTIGDKFSHFRDYFTAKDEINAWFEWILCYGGMNDESYERNGSSSSNSNSSGEYFVVHRYGYESCRWLAPHLEAMGRSSLLSTCIDNNDSSCTSTESALGWPYSTLEAIQQGYMIYFEESENICKWIRLQCGTVENFLPLGSDEEGCYDVGCIPHHVGNGNSNAKVNAKDVGLWVGCPQECSTQWVIVLVATPPTTSTTAATATANINDSDYYDHRNRRRKQKQVEEVCSLIGLWTDNNAELVYYILYA